MDIGRARQRVQLHAAEEVRGAAIRSGELSAKFYVNAWFDQCADLAHSSSPEEYDIIAMASDSEYSLDKFDASSLCTLLGFTTFTELLDRLRGELAIVHRSFPYKVQVYRVADLERYDLAAFVIRPVKQ